MIITFSNHFKYQLAAKLVDMANDTILAILMKPGFVFDEDVHATKSTLKATSGSLYVDIDAAAFTITRATGSFVTDGFVVGNQITTTSGTNPGPFTISSVAALVLTLDSDSTLYDETGTFNITADDELETGYGYTQLTKTLGTLAISEDDTDDRGEFTCADIDWTAAGGAIGPTPGMILIDDTVTDDTIICYFDFEGDLTALDTSHFKVVDIELRIS